MALQVDTLTFDCEDPGKMASFWADALGLVTNEGASEQFVSLSPPDGRDGPRWFFFKVPESKIAKNRLHLDLGADDPAAEIERLIALGATKLADKDEWNHQWSVLHDVEGNEFCVSAVHG